MTKKIAHEIGVKAIREGRATPEQQREVGSRYTALLAEKNRLLAEISKLSQRKTPVLITLASDARCAQSQWCFVDSMKPDRKKAWIERHDLFLSDDRVFALVTTSKEVFYMDCITGSLYALGECMTSSKGRTGFKRNNEKAAEMLMKWNFDGVNGKENDDDL